MISKAGAVLQAIKMVIYTDEDIVTLNHPQVIGGNTLNLYAVWERNEVEVTVKDGTSS